MKFSARHIKEFQSLWKRETGQEIDEATAAEYAQNIVGLMESVVEWRRARVRDPPS